MAPSGIKIVLSYLSELIEVLGFLSLQDFETRNFGMAGLASKLRIQSTDVKAAAMWGVAATTGALYLIQPWGWLKRTFLEKPEPEQK